MVTVDSPEVLAWCGDLDSDDGFRFNGLRYVGGVDISFKKETPNEACAMLVVLSFPELKVWYDEHVSLNKGQPLQLVLFNLIFKIFRKKIGCLVCSISMIAF